MSIATQIEHRWDTREYAQIVGARFDAGALVVAFNDGTIGTVDPERLVPVGWQVTDWNALSFDTYEVTVPTAAGPLEIPWDVIRREADPEFLAHWVAREQAIATRVGSRLRKLREARGLTTRQLGAKARISADVIARIEAGRAQAGFQLLEMVLGAMGHTPDDLIAEAESGGGEA